MNGFVGGRCLVASRVIDQIIAKSAADVEGVVEVRGFDAATGELRHGYEKSIVTEVGDGALVTSLILSVAPGASIVRVVEAVQQSVKEDVEMMFGLSCRRIDVLVI